MASEFSIQVRGGMPVLKVLSQLRARMADMTPAWQEVGDELVTRTRLRFRTKTNPDGVPWADWSPEYAEWRKKHTGAVGRGQILELTRMMLESINATPHRDGLILGLGRSYAPFHERGTRFMPRRGFLLADYDPEPRLGKQDAAVVLEILTDHLTGGDRG